MKRSTQHRRKALAALIVGSAIFSVGCSGNGGGISSLNPFNRSVASTGTVVETGKLAADPTAPTAAPKTQLASFGSSTKAALAKTSSAVSNLFVPGSGEDGDGAVSRVDPTSLNNKTTSISPDIFVKNGRLWESTGNVAKAMESYKKALGEDPDDVPALKAIAKLHFSQGNYKQSIDFFKQAITRNPRDADAYSDCGLAFEKLGQNENAKKALAMALQLAPGTSRHANRMATLRFDEGDKTGAFEVLAENNKPAVANFNMAYLHYKAGQLEDAKKHLTETMKYEPIASSDGSVKQAVDRSRQMLAQLTAEAPGRPAGSGGSGAAIANRGRAQSGGGRDRVAAASTGPTQTPSIDAAVKQARAFSDGLQRAADNARRNEGAGAAVIASSRNTLGTGGAAAGPEAQIAARPTRVQAYDGRSASPSAGTTGVVPRAPATFSGPFTPGSTSSAGYYGTTVPAPSRPAAAPSEGAIPTGSANATSAPPTSAPGSGGGVSSGGFSLPPSMRAE